MLHVLREKKKSLDSVKTGVPVNIAAKLYDFVRTKQQNIFWHFLRTRAKTLHVREKSISFALTWSAVLGFGSYLTLVEIVLLFLTLLYRERLSTLEQLYIQI